MRLRLALTLVLTGLATAVGVLLTVAMALQRAEREATFARADAFVQRVAQQHGDLLARQRAEPEALQRFLRSLLLLDPNQQLYLLDPEGRILARTGMTPLPDGFRVAIGPVRQAARVPAPGGGAAAAMTAGAYVMGDDPEFMDRDAVVAAQALRRLEGAPHASITGYLYIVCRPPGPSRSRLAELGRHLNLGLLAPVLAVVLLATALAAWIIDGVTRPLAALSREVDAAARAGFGAAPMSGLHSAAPDRDDEIGRLRRGFAQLLMRLGEQWAQLRHLDAFRRESVSNLSHDLRSPLTAAVASLETLLQRWPADGAQATQPAHSAQAALPVADRRLIEVALRNTQGAARLVQALGDLAVLDEAEFKLRLMRLDLVEVLDDIGARFVERARLAGLELEVAIDACGSEALAAEIDIELFERALANLLDNAIRHTPPGGRIVLGACRSASGLQVRVSDTGCGMAPELLSRVFERHVRGPQPSVAGRDGSRHGLGLAIVQRILELHRGRVTLHSSPGAGTTVLLDWPAPEEASSADGA